MKTKKSLFSKRLIAIMLTAFMATTAAFAAQRTLEEMKSIAYAAFNLDNTQTDPFQVPLLDVKCKSSDLLDASLFKNDEEAFYIFAFTNGAPGYVIVSADTRLPEVIAYSASSRFDGNKMPEPMKAFLQTYVEKMNNTPKNFVAKRRAPGRFFANAATSPSVEPLLGNIAFNQREPYNNACPVYSGDRCVTGCVATAMAQIMKYHQYPTKMTGNYISYTTGSYSIPVTWDPSSTTFDWKKIKDTYSSYVAPYTANETVTNTAYMSVGSVSFDEEYGDIILQNFFNISGETLSCTVQCILTDNNGEFMRPVPSEKTFSELGNGWGWNSYYIWNLALPASIDDGNYRLYIGVKKDGTSEWSYVKQKKDGSLQEFYLSVTKTGSFFTIEGSDYIYSCGYNDEEAAEVAKLHAACGASVNMNYGIDASSAYDNSIAPALVNYFSYDKNNEMITPEFFSEANWHQHIQNELQNGRPVIVGGQSVERYGHEFLIDGYRYDGSQPFYSVNWGWGGSNNGYFLIDNLQPSSGGTGGAAVNYSYDYNIICGVQPDNYIDEGVAIGCGLYTVDKTDYSAGDWLTLSSSDSEKLKNCSPNQFNGDIIVYASNGTSDYLLGSFSVYLRPYHYYLGMTYNFTIPSTIPTGTYRIIMKSKEKDSNVEKEVYTAEAPEVQINGSFLPGDVDMSGEVNITDVVALVNYILSNDSSSSVLSNGDMDGNGTIDITDVVALVNLILSN